MSTMTRVPVTKSVPPTKVERIESFLAYEYLAQAIARSLPVEESLAFYAWVKDAKPEMVELREIGRELLDDPASEKSIMRGLTWMESF